MALPAELAALVAASGVTDVLVQAGGVYVDRGSGLELTEVAPLAEADRRALAVRLAAAAGRRLDLASPFVDARIGSGLRLHAAVPPVAVDGTALSLRVLSPVARPLAELAGGAPVATLLRAVVRSRLPFLVSGGTGSGKTTLLAALLSECEPAERLLLVEDVAELRPKLPHVVRLEARAPNVEGAGAVSQGQLVRQALRMRPDRIVIGELRGAEVAELLHALNTGHEGGATTLHANSVADVPARLDALGSLAGLSSSALARQVVAGLRVVAHVRRDRAGGRAVTSVGWMQCRGDGSLEALEAVAVVDGRLRPGPGAAALHEACSRRGWPPW